MHWYELADQVDTLRESARKHLDIVEVWVRLPRYEEQHSIRGNIRKMALCLFHSEKTPSVRIWPESQRFLCHGCEVGGDVFDLLEEAEGCKTSFDSIRHLPLVRQREEIQFFKEILEKYLGYKLYPK